VLVRLVLLFTLLPLVELWILLWIADQTRWEFTLGLVIATGVLGASLARHQGLRCWRQFQQRLAEGELPAAELLDGLMILVAAAVLVTPGVITDLAGFLLLVPPVRRLVRRQLSRRLAARVVVRQSAAPPWAARDDDHSDSDQIIDVESRPAGGSHPDQQ